MQIIKERYQQLEGLEQKKGFWVNQVNRLLKGNAHFFNIFNRNVYNTWVDVEPDFSDILPFIADRFSFNLELILKHIQEPELTNIPTHICIYEYKKTNENFSYKLTKPEREVLVYSLILSGNFDKNVEKFYDEMQTLYPEGFKDDSKERILGAHQVFLRRKKLIRP